GAQYADQIQQALGRLKCSERRACVAISCSSAMVCQTEFPRMALDEVRNALKLGSAQKYLRRDLSDYCIDVAELTPAAENKSTGKMMLLVGGATKLEVAGYREALTAAKVRPEVMELAAVSVVNAFQLSKPDVAENVVLLVDIGARSTSLNFVRNGQP